MTRPSNDIYVDWEDVTEKLDSLLLSLHTYQRGYDSLKASLNKLFEEKRAVRSSIRDINLKLSKLHLDYTSAVTKWFNWGGTMDNIWLDEGIAERKKTYDLSLVDSDKQLKVLTNQLNMLKLNCEKTEDSIGNFKSLIHKKQKEITKIHEVITLVAITDISDEIEPKIKIPVYAIKRISLNIRHTMKREHATVYFASIRGVWRKSKTPDFKQYKHDKYKPARPEEELMIKELFSPLVN